MRVTSRIRTLLLIVTAFWVYVTISDVLYASSMQWSLTALHVRHFFAPSTSRVLQHLVLYPLLLACMAASLRVGWRPTLRCLPLQILLGMFFAALGYPAQALGLWLLGAHPALALVMSSEPAMRTQFFHVQMHIWFTTANSFFLTYGFGLALVSGFDMYSRLRDSQTRSAALERALTAAHLASLRLQLSPHSLFNLLHTIRGEIDWDPAAAQNDDRAARRAPAAAAQRGRARVFPSRR